MSTRWQDNTFINLVRKLLPGVNSVGEQAAEDYPKYRELLLRDANPRVGPPDARKDRNRLAAITDIMVGSDPSSATNILQQASAPQSDAPPTDKMREMAFRLGLTDRQNERLDPKSVDGNVQLLREFAGITGSGQGGMEALQGYSGRAPNQFTNPDIAERLERSKQESIAANRAPPTPNQFTHPELAMQLANAKAASAARHQPAAAPKQSVFDVATERGAAKGRDEARAFFTDGSSDAAETAIADLGKMIDHEGFDSHYGSFQWAETAKAAVPGSNARDFSNLKERVVGQQILKGLDSFSGQISDRDLMVVEKATAIVNDTRSSHEAVQEAIKDLQGLFQSKLDSKRRLAQTGSAAEYDKVYAEIIRESGGAPNNSGWGGEVAR